MTVHATVASAAVFRPRSGPEIFDAAVIVARRAYAGCVVVWLAYLMIQDPFMWAVTGTWPQWARSLLLYATPAIPGAMLEILLSDAYLNRPVRLDRALAVVARRAAAVVTVRMLRLLAIALGFVAFIFPGIGLWALTFAAGPAVVIEGATVRGAFIRSRQLTEGDLPRIAVILGVALLCWSLIVISVYGAHPGAASYDVLHRPLRRVVFIAVSAMTVPFIDAVVIVLYYDLRIRREGLDLELMALAVPSAPAPPATPSAGAEGM